MTHKLAIIIPYRNREEHLTEFLRIVPDKINQGRGASEQIEFRIFVIEQGNDKLFNRGKLNNIGVALTKHDYDYFCFHDVDMMPILADYSYPEIPTHLAYYASQFADWAGAGLAYPTYFGGVVLFNREDFVQVNGFSNEYWGYGAEDDDLLVRVLKKGLKWTRRQGYFESLPHPLHQQGVEQNKTRLVKILKKEEEDTTGLSTLQFSVIKEEHFSTHAFYSVDI